MLAHLQGYGHLALKVMADVGSLMQRCLMHAGLCISLLAHAHWHMGGAAHAGLLHQSAGD
jgi:hypothetical protein